MIDLHLHTVYSDGTQTPREVVSLGKDRGLTAVSITDHDTVAGIGEALAVGSEVGIEVVPGIEMSSDANHNEVHILGYYIDWKSEKLIERLRYFQHTRKERNSKLLERLSELSMPVDLDQLDGLPPRGVIGRLHIARAMIAGGYVSSVSEAFEEWLNPGKPAHVGRVKASPCDVIRIILDAGGVPVFAHPFLSGRDDLIPRMVDAGLMGIEVLHPAHSQSMMYHYKRIADERGLVLTGGSDCHGEANGRPKIGMLKVPTSYLDNLKKARQRVDQQSGRAQA